jgi:hypothetical protein
MLRKLGFLGWLWGFFAIYLILGAASSMVLLDSDSGSLSWKMLVVDAAVFAILLTITAVVGFVRWLRR